MGGFGGSGSGVYCVEWGLGLEKRGRILKINLWQTSFLIACRFTKTIYILYIKPIFNHFFFFLLVVVVVVVVATRTPTLRLGPREVSSTSVTRLGRFCGLIWGGTSEFCVSFLSGIQRNPGPAALLSWILLG